MANEFASRFTERLGREVKDYPIVVEEGIARALLTDVEATMEEVNALLLWANHMGKLLPCIQEERGAAPILGAPVGSWFVTPSRRVPASRFPPVHSEDDLEGFKGMGNIVWARPGGIPGMIHGVRPRRPGLSRVLPAWRRGSDLDRRKWHHSSPASTVNTNIILLCDDVFSPQAVNCCNQLL